MLKEALALYESGHDIHVIWCPISKWADKYDEMLFSKYSMINWLKAGYHPRDQRFSYLYARVRQKLWEFVFKVFGDISDAAVRGHVLFSQELIKKTLRCEAHLYIGHNLGALPALVKAKNKFSARLIFDLEDFHRGEYNHDDFHHQVVCCIEEKYLPKIEKFTASSPGIASAYLNLFPSMNIDTIVNVFPRSYAYQNLTTLKDVPLKLFWFSQYAGLNRGLNTVIEAMGILRGYDITLTILANISSELKSFFNTLAKVNGVQNKKIIYLETVPEYDIVKIAAQHHIGIASEVSNTVNRDICLTNKIFMYLLAGNAVVFSNTSSQKEFLSQNPEIGTIYKQSDSEELAHLLLNYIKNPGTLSSQRENAFVLSQTSYNWDTQKLKFIANVSQFL